MAKCDPRVKTEALIYNPNGSRISNTLGLFAQLSPNQNIPMSFNETNRNILTLRRFP